MLGTADAERGNPPTPDLARTRVRLFARAVRARRAALELSQEQLTEHARLDESVSAEIETAERGPDLQELIDLAEALDTKPDAPPRPDNSAR